MDMALIVRGLDIVIIWHLPLHSVCRFDRWLSSVRWIQLERLGKWRVAPPIVLGLVTLGWAQWWWSEWAGYYGDSNDPDKSTRVEHPAWG